VKEDQTTIVIQVQPNARQNSVTHFEDGVWHFRIAAPPVQGKANRELIRFLSDILGVGKGNLTIRKGIISRRKVISVKGLTQSRIALQMKKLSTH